MVDSTVVAFLRGSACIPGVDSDDNALIALARAVPDWTGVPAEAEAHGLAPLVDSHVRRLGLPVPTGPRRELAALALGHRRHSAAQVSVLADVLERLEAADIRVVVLKGAALAHLVYPSSALRPMSDIDVLVPRRDAHRAQEQLTALGFEAPIRPTAQRLIGHHHLPPAIIKRDGWSIRVELHVDALNPDTPGALTLDDLISPPQHFTVDGRAAVALGHADMLYHLCRHMAERAPVLRLIWVADVIGYAMKHESDIDWPLLDRRYPFVANTLGLLHFVRPLPEALLRHLPSPAARPPSGAGVACVPLAVALRPGRPVAAVARDLFWPTEWWLRLYYGLTTATPLFWHRCVRHPAHVVGWLLRRVGTFARWRLGWL